MGIFAQSPTGSLQRSLASTVLLRWSDGFVVGDVPLGRGKAPSKAGKAPSKSVSLGGSRRRNVERYSPSYHSIAFLSDSCLKQKMLLVALAHGATLVYSLTWAARLRIHTCRNGSWPLRRIR